MTDTKALEARIEKSGLKLKYVAKKMGISYASLRYKMDNVREFTATEIYQLCEIVGITDLEEKYKLFFCQKG